MTRVRFVTASAVGAVACEGLAGEPPADGVSTPSICFEWLVLEAFVRRLAAPDFPQGVPGSAKARNVVNRGQRLSAATYLKGPKVFGFNGVYKPFATDAGVLDGDLAPGPRCAEITRVWERENAADGFTDGGGNTVGGRLRRDLLNAVRNALRSGHVATPSGSWLLGRLADRLHPFGAHAAERAALRSLVLSPEHESRSQLGRLLGEIPADANLTEAECLRMIRPRCDAALGALVDAVVAYEEFALLVDSTFRTLCSISYSLGSAPMTPALAAAHPTLIQASSELPVRFERAIERMDAIDAAGGFHQEFIEFASPRGPEELVSIFMARHEEVQRRKPPGGKRSWFDPLRDGWVVRPSFGQPDPPELGESFVHPVRVAALRRFLVDTAP